VNAEAVHESTLEARYRSPCSAGPSAKKRWSINPSGKPPEAGYITESVNTVSASAPRS